MHTGSLCLGAGVTGSHPWDVQSSPGDTCIPVTNHRVPGPAHLWGVTTQAPKCSCSTMQLSWTIWWNVLKTQGCTDKDLRFRNSLPDNSWEQQEVPRPLRCPGCPGDKGSSTVDSLLSSHSYSWCWVTTVSTWGLCFPFLFNSLFNVPYLPILTQLAHLTVPSGRLIGSGACL